MANYYFVAPSLPQLVWGEWPEITFEELIARLKLNLTTEDFEMTSDMRYHIDFLNLRALFLKLPIDPRGNLREKELDDALLTESHLSDYVFEFLKRFPSDQDRIQNLSFLLTRYYRDEMQRCSGFLQAYFTFEWQWRLVLSALRAKDLGRDIAFELRYEDPSDYFVQGILSQKDAANYEPPKEYQDLKERYISCGSDPWQHFEVFSKWRLERLGLLPTGPLFSIDWILAYLAQHLLVEDGMRLSLERGEEILRTIAQA